MLAIVYSSVYIQHSSLCLCQYRCTCSEPTKSPVLPTYSTVCPSPLLDALVILVPHPAVEMDKWWSEHTQSPAPHDLEPLPMVILTLLPSTEIGGPPGLALETVDILNIQAKFNLSILIAYLITTYIPVHYTITRYFCTHFDCIFVIMSVFKKQLHLIS